MINCSQKAIPRSNTCNSFTKWNMKHNSLEQVKPCADHIKRWGKVGRSVKLLLWTGRWFYMQLLAIEYRRISWVHDKWQQYSKYYSITIFKEYIRSSDKKVEDTSWYKWKTIQCDQNSLSFCIWYTKKSTNFNKKKDNFACKVSAVHSKLNQGLETVRTTIKFFS